MLTISFVDRKLISYVIQIKEILIRLYDMLSKYNQSLIKCAVFKVIAFSERKMCYNIRYLYEIILVHHSLNGDK